MVRFAGGIAAVLALAFLLGGCGSKYTRADFRARANAICATAVRQARSLTPPAAATSHAQQMKALSAYLFQLVPVVETESTQLVKLKTPPGSDRESTRDTGAGKWVAFVRKSERDSRVTRAI